MEPTPRVPWQEVGGLHSLIIVFICSGHFLAPCWIPAVLFLLGLDRACPNVILLEVVQVENYLIRVS